MAGYRLDRTNDDIQLVLSELLRSIKDPRINQGMISVTRTETIWVTCAIARFF